MATHCACCLSPCDDAPTCSRCSGSSLLGGRFRLVGPGQTVRGEHWFTAVDGEQPRRALTARALRPVHTESISLVERFEREVQILRTLDHPAIPGFVWDGRSGGEASDPDSVRWLVTEAAFGQSLADELAQRRYTEAEVAEILGSVLETLGYLQALRPPLLHGDIRPANLIRSEPGRRLLLAGLGAGPDGEMAYWPPEQKEGRPVPASDLYAVGVLGVALLSRRNPAELLSERGLAWESAVTCGEPLRGVLHALLTPRAEDRASDPLGVARRLGLAPGQDHQVVLARPVARAGRAMGAATGPVDLTTPPPSAPRLPRKRLLLKSAPVTWFKTVFGGVLGGINVALGAVLALVLNGPAAGIGLLLLATGLGFGATVFRSGLRERDRLQRIWERGQVCIGEVRWAKLDPRIRVNNQPAVQLEVVWDVGGQRYEALHRTMDGRAKNLPRGAPITLLYEAEDPSRTLLYLPDAT